ncbi:PH domain-containing protein [Acrocarpospora phusangensis]|uniref:PH domain-containing protein n=1 Tax=Acrocarpospora phusangensis TaxID=1070424 RepID=UPI001951DEE7|nr:PH domain-containing protein [Acrocarpospora phusangensis]
MPEFFRPRPSRGYVSLAVVAAPVGFSAANSLAAGTHPETVIALLLTPMAAYLTALTFCFPLMRYAVSATTLTAQYGPLLRYRIPLSEIVSVTRVQLSPRPFAVIALPGIALYAMHCLGIGRVRMCATRPTHRILLIKTNRGTCYGLTPADDKAFLDALRRRGVRVTPF